MTHGFLDPFAFPELTRILILNVREEAVSATDWLLFWLELYLMQISNLQSFFHSESRNEV